MIRYKIEQSNSSFCLKITNIEHSVCGLAFAGGIGLLMFLLPIAVTIFIMKGLSLGGTVSWLFAWIISGYFLKLYLWNKHGEEVFIIKNNKLEAYNNYKYFKENHRYYQFTELCITFFVGTEAFFANENVKFFNKNELSKIGFQLDEEVITSHRELPISKIMEIAKQIKPTNNRR
jgi:hypothetical protein